MVSYFKNGASRQRQTALGDPVRFRPAAVSLHDDFQSEQDSYRLASESLLRILEERKDALSPETLSVVYENVRIIDRAIQNIREALEHDPGSPQLNLLLLETYQKEVELLRLATKLPARI